MLLANTKKQIGGEKQSAEKAERKKTRKKHRSRERRTRTNTSEQLKLWHS